MGADLDLDELERLSQARPTDGPAVLEYLAALYLSAPALIAAARERDRLRALCREAAERLGPLAWKLGTEDERAIVQRLRAAGGGT